MNTRRGSTEQDGYAGRVPSTVLKNWSAEPWGSSLKPTTAETWEEKREIGQGWGDFVRFIGRHKRRQRGKPLIQEHEDDEGNDK